MRGADRSGPTQQPPIGPGVAPIVGLSLVSAAMFGSLTIGALVGSSWRWRPRTTRETITYVSGMFSGSRPLDGYGVRAPLAGVVTVATLLLVTVAFVAIVSKRMANTATKSRGLAVRRDLVDMSAEAHMAKLDVYRPGHTGPVSPYTTGVALGTAHTGQQVWGTIEDTYSVIGPPRSSKTRRFIAPFVAHFEGSVLVTGLRPEIVMWTMDWRTKGVRWVFDPADGLDLKPGLTRLRWSPLVGCTDELTALQRATAMFGARPDTGSNEAYWRQEGRNVLTAYLLAAATAGETIMKVMQWADRSTSTEPVEILRGDGDSLAMWGDSLAAAVANEPRYKAGVWGQVKQALEPFLLPSVRAVTVVPVEESFTAEEFIAGWNTLYMLGSPSEQHAVAGLCAALADHVIENGRREARRLGRMTIPLGLALDEAANTAPIPNLDQVMSSCGGSGMCLAVVVQSVGQARKTWGDEVGAALLRDLATQRIVLGGLGSAQDLKDIVDLLGEHDELVRSVSSRGGRGMMAAHDVSMNTRLRPVLTENQIRELRSQKLGEALLIPRSGKPIITRLPAIHDMEQ